MNEPTYCHDCGNPISPHASHIGCEKWCEDCFESGLSKDMDEHFVHTIKTELAEDRDKKIREVVEYCLKHERFNFMWCATILGILFDCDFRDAERTARKWLNEQNQNK